MLLSLILLLSISASEESYDCSHRYRRSWYSLTSDEQSLYISGYKKLRQNGKLSVISSTYNKLSVINKFQDSSLFFFIHEHFIYEFENAMRSLGNEYKCFSMPYWDFTMDSGLERDEKPIFNTGIGGDGDNINNYCIQSDNWNINDYWTPFAINCAQNEMNDDDDNDNDNKCCLKRSISKTQILPSSIEIAFVIEHNDNFIDFSNDIHGYIDNVYAFFGSSIFNAPMTNDMASEDPIYFLLASFIGYLRSIWTDCHDFDLIQQNQLQNYPEFYSSFDNYPNHNNEYDLDYPLNDIFYDLNNEQWTKLYQSENPLTIRDLIDISSNGIVYDLGSFAMRSKLNTFCNGHINGNWFIASSSSLLSSSSYDKDISSPLNEYIDKIWNSLSQYEIDQDEKFKVASSLSCDFNRKTSLNSCFMDIDDNHNYYINDDENYCDNMNEMELNELTLNDLYDFIGDRINNECLLKIRNERWSYVSGNILLKKNLCNGGFDYKCNVYGGFDDGSYDDVTSIIDDGYDVQNANGSNYDFFSFNTSLWSVIVWCSMFIFIFMTCCYMFIVKKDFETEEMYKKHRQNAHVVIYGSIDNI